MTLQRRLLIIAALAVVVLLFLISFAYRSIPQPIIEIRGETLWEITLVPGLPEVLGTLPIRNTLLTSWCIVAFIVVLAFLLGRGLKWLPGGSQNFVEMVIEGIHELVVNTAGEKNGRRFFWVIATFFIYIAMSNWFALLPIFNVIGKMEPIGAEKAEFHEHAVVVEKQAGISLINFKAEKVDIEVDEAACNGLEKPEKDHCLEERRAEAIADAEDDLGEGEELAILAPYFRSVNTDLMTPLSLAVASAIFVEFWGISTLGLVSYAGKFFNFGALRRGPMGFLDFFVGILELFAEVARLISFSFRLFGNMIAGEILLLVMTFLLPFTFMVVSIFYGLEIFVGAIQAFVFGMLTLVFGMLAVSGHGEGHAEEEGH
ncbi:MAG: F0F1 ATP synthase subunit A [Dehalococcoidia bacterium]